jgi:hypothetical protein
MTASLPTIAPSSEKAIAAQSIVSPVSNSSTTSNAIRNIPEESEGIVIWLVGAAVGGTIVGARVGTSFG